MKDAWHLMIQFVSKHKWLSLAYFLLLIYFLGESLISPVLEKEVIDLAVAGDPSGLMSVAICYVGLLVITALLDTLMSYIEEYAKGSLSNEMHRRTVGDLLRMHFSRIRAQKFGQIVRLVNQDTQSIERIGTTTIPHMIRNAIMAVAMMVYLFFINIPLTCVLLVGIIAVFAGNRLLIPLIRQRQAALIAQEEKLNDLVDECFAGAESIRAMNAEPFFLKRAQQFLDQLFHTRLSSAKVNIAYDSAVLFNCSNLMGAAITVIGAFCVLNGAITIGTIQIFTSYYIRIVSSLMEFMSISRDIKVKQLSIQRLQDFHDAASDPSAINQCASLPPLERLTLRDVGFAYLDHAIFQHLHLDIQPGERLFIAGNNGSGKTSLAYLLSAMYRPAQGEIFYNAHAYSQLSPEAIRKKVVLIPSEPFLIEGTVDDNFWGYPVIEDGIVSRIKDQPIRKNGSNLSSGQKKQLQIMRSLSNEAEIYILDEPFNFVDTDSKKAVWDYILQHLHDKTLIIISHDPYPRKDCTRAVRLTQEGFCSEDVLSSR